MVVKTELEKLGIDYVNVTIGEAKVQGKISSEKMAELDLNLKNRVFY